MNELLEKLCNIEALLEQQNILKKEILNSEEACKYLNVSLDNIYRLTSSGAIPSYRPNGRYMYFKLNDLNEWLLHKKNNTKKKRIENQVNNFFSPKTKKIIR